MRSNAARLLLLATSFAALPMAAQNYLTNPTLDSGLTGWSVSTYATWSPLDANGSPGSGSLLLTNSLSGGSGTVSRQCLVLPAGRTYFFGAKERVASGQTSTGEARLQVSMHSTPDCQGAPLKWANANKVGAADVWTPVSGKAEVPSNAASMALVLTAWKLTDGGPFQARFDDLWLSPATPTTLTIPSSASIHGNAGAFFHSDLWVVNHSSYFSQTITAQYRCFTGQNCPSGTKSFVLGPRQSILYSDVVGPGLLAAPETAGAIELTYERTLGSVSASSRVYTPSLPSPTSGTSVPAMEASEARTRTLFLGLGSNGGNLTSGFRSNAGAYNPNASSVSVTFTLYNGPTGAKLGTPLTRTWAANEAYQISDIFAAVGAGTSVTTNAYLVVTSTSPVFPFVTVIDNKSSDSVWAKGLADAP